MEATSMELRLENIEKDFQEQEVLKGATYSFEAGHIYGLLGRNGSGKTTLFRILYGDLESDDGQAHLVEAGQVKAIEPEDIGMVFAENYLPDFLTGYEYIKFYMDIHAPKDSYSVDDCLDRLGFSQKDRHRIIKGYSSGMKSKLAILCLLISKPKIILLDEPLTAIDVISSLEIKRLLLDLGMDHIMIMSTHMIQLAKDICDDIVLLHQGQLRHFESALEDEDFDQSLIEALSAEDEDHD